MLIFKTEKKTHIIYKYYELILIYNNIFLYVILDDEKS